MTRSLIEIGYMAVRVCVCVCVCVCERERERGAHACRLHKDRAL